MPDDPGSIPTVSILIYFLCVFLCGYFSGSEISFASVNRIHMMSLSSKGNKSAKRVLYILDNFEEALSVLLIGNNAVNIGCATISVVIATNIWGSKSVSIATVVTTAVIFIFGEMIPKCFARSCNEKFAMAVSASLIFLMKILKPLSVFFTAISSVASKPFIKRSEPEPTMTEDELYDIVENISPDDDFDEETGELVKSALNFSDRTVNEILVPWDDVVKINMSMKTSEILELINSTVHSRLPVIDRRGNLKGILQIRKFLKAYIKQKNNVILSSIIDYPYFAKNTTSIDDLLSDMSNHRRNIAVIKNEDGDYIGIVTVEDILEELVGEIFDEDDIGGGDLDE